METSENPQKIGEAIELFPRTFDKTLLRQKFYNPRLAHEEEYILFDSSTRPIVVLPLTAEHSVIAVKQFRYAAGRSLIELPGGNVQPGESPEDAARRELEEETGLRPSAIIALTPDPVWFDPATLTTPFLAFLALNCRIAGKPRPEPDEHFDVLTIRVPEWIAKIENGFIRDAKSIVTTFLALPHLQGSDRATL